MRDFFIHYETASEEMNTLLNGFWGPFYTERVLTITRQILFELHSNHRYFCPYDLVILWMTLTNHRALSLCHVKIFASFQSHWWIQTGVTVWKCQNWVKIGDFFVPCDLVIRRMNKRIPPLCYVKLCASFRSQQWIRIGLTVRKPSIQIKIFIFFSHVGHWNLTDDLQ